MRTFHTSVTNLRQTVADEFVTENFECGWAFEAVYFVTAEQQGSSFERLELRPQFSPDGIQWVDDGSTLPTMTGPGLMMGRVGHFGGWLRLAGRCSGGAGRATITVRLVLKG